MHPRFGYASPYQQNLNTVADSLGMQVLQEGFMLVNLNYLIIKTWDFETDLFLADTNLDSNFTALYDQLSSDFRVNLLTPHWNLLPEREVIIQGEDSIFYSRKDPIYQEIDHFASGV
ncbi:MAG: hypothetical protein P1Q69_18430 [Candidatus Thorarchaeota archaeon]|nr:hypothetical protein [Candidatus Thorarchaeota archaeon]